MLYIILEVIKMESTVTVRGQTAIPVVIRKRYNIKPKTKLEWIDDGQSIILLPIPEEPIKALKGKFKKLDLRKALLKSRKEGRRNG
jgi:bifunctional DNA-binding transcriptional regulator/antitoxin component of YhaV-PrlF toxin-antitoxin module